VHVKIIGKNRGFTGRDKNSILFGETKSLKYQTPKRRKGNVQK